MSPYTTAALSRKDSGVNGDELAGLGPISFIFYVMVVQKL